MLQKENKVEQGIFSISLVTFLSTNNWLCAILLSDIASETPMPITAWHTFMTVSMQQIKPANVFSYLIIYKQKVDNLEFFSPNTSKPHNLWLLSAGCLCCICCTDCIGQLQETKPQDSKFLLDIIFSHICCLMHLFMARPNQTTSHAQHQRKFCTTWKKVAPYCTWRREILPLEVNNQSHSLFRCYDYQI